MKFYVAVLEQDCTPHYFEHVDNAKNYLTNTVTISDTTLDSWQTIDCGELWNHDGISVGYYYEAQTED